jgi:hypothetical protein
MALMVSAKNDRKSHGLLAEQFYLIENQTAKDKVRA